MKSPALPSCLGPLVYRAAPEGGWGWAVAAAFFLVEVCTYGTIKSLGVFLQDFMDEFGESISRVSWVISICVFILTFTAPLSTALSHRFGHRPVVMTGGFLISLGTITSAFTSSIAEMYVTIGIVSGLGYCLTFLPTVTILAQYFSRRRALVTSVASSGESIAIFAFAPALTTLKKHIGWRRCLLLLGVLQASVIGCGLLLRPITIEPEAEPDDDSSSRDSPALRPLQEVYELENEKTSISSGGSKDSGVTSLSTSHGDLGAKEGKDPTEWEAQAEEAPSLAEKKEEKKEAPPEVSWPKLLDPSVLRDPSFVWYCLFGLFATLGFFAPQLYVIPLSRSRGLEAHLASYMLSVMAVAEIAGRLSIGALLSRVRCRKTLVLLGCVVVLGLVLAAFAVVWDFWGLVVCCALYGYFMGTVGSTHIPLLAEEEVVGVHRMSAAVGVYVCVQSFAGLAGPPLGGVLVDATGNYGAAFYSCAVGMGLSAVCLAMVGPAKSGMCPARNLDKGSEQEEEKMAQDDFLDVDLVPEDSPERKAPGGAAVV